MNSKPVFSYKEFDDSFALYRRGREIAMFSGMEATQHFMVWLVDTLNRNHAEFTKSRTDKVIRELGF